MLLNSSNVIAKWTARYSGISLYLANAAAQSAALSGGTTPTTGFHSVIDKPERVSRVIPPTTTIRKIIAQQMKSQAATEPDRGSVRAPVATPDCAVLTVEIDRARSPKNRDMGQSESAPSR